MDGRFQDFGDLLHKNPSFLFASRVENTTYVKIKLEIIGDSWE
jgi:hypothetical protein